MTAPAVARLTSPGEILAALPTLCGFPPAESLVVLSLRGPRKRVGLTARIDLPAAEDEDAVARMCAARMAADGASWVVVAVYGEAGRRERLVDAVVELCAAEGVRLMEALHVQAGLWTSYRCTGACCPFTGTPLPTGSPALGLIDAERTAAGRVVLASREELVRSVAPPVLLAAAAAQQAFAEAREAELAWREEHGATAARARALQHARHLLGGVAEGRPVAAADAAALAVRLLDVHARDEVATLMLDSSDELLSLLLQTARLVAPPDDAPVCTLLGWVAYARGEGALTNVALDRALDSRPDYSLALLLRQCLDGGISPDDIRAMTRGTGEVLTRKARRRTRRPG